MPTCVIPPGAGPRARRLKVLVEYPEDAQRPRTRGDCVNGPRPCPWISCRYNLAINVLPSGSLQVDTRDPLPESCALDVADRGEHSMEQTGEVLGLTREAVRIIEMKAFAKVRALKALEGL